LFFTLAGIYMAMILLAYAAVLALFVAFLDILGPAKIL
jgi:hypothetical protein